jgi:mannobiose 2-epimerase
MIVLGTQAAARGSRAPSLRELDSQSVELLRPVLMRLGRMAREVVDFWMQHGPDPVHGGFHGFLDRRGQPADPTDKGVIQQARHLWTFSTWFERREPTEAVKAVADNLYRFLVGRMLDREDGEFFYRVSRAGEALDRKKLLYAQSFAIYGLATYGRVFRVPNALDQAVRCFESVDGRAHDASRGGYDQRGDIDWLAPGASKDTNTHIHLMEGFTALLDATGNAKVRDRVSELSQIVGHRLLQSSGYVHADFDLDFGPVGPPLTSYGHDLETAWLLLDACRALGEWPESIVGAALRMGLHSAVHGFDAKKGGYFYAGPPNAGPTQLEKIWWVQFEALPSLWWLHRLTGDPIHLRRLERTLTWLENGQHDPEFGGWFYGINPDGNLGPRGDHKGELWKASYHDLRALAYTEGWIRELLPAP